MIEDKTFRLDNSDFTTSPFPHFCCQSILAKDVENALFHWLNETNAWKIIKTDFYEQYEFSLFDVSPPEELHELISESGTSEIQASIQSSFNLEKIDLVGITAHKHISGQSIGIHNDFINGDETHRLVLQVNSGWDHNKGGFLMLFDSADASDLAKLIKPISNSGIVFEISKHSHHAVSQINDFDRLSIVYTFHASDNKE